MRYWFYRRQGIKFPSLPIPIVGDFFEVIKRTIRDPLRFHICDIVREGVKEDCPDINGFIYPGKIALFINGPELVQECYVAKNLFLDKHEKTKMLVKGLAEKAIVFAETN